MERHHSFITCDFTPPEVVTDSFHSRRTGETLTQLVCSSLPVQTLRATYEAQPKPSVYDEALAELEQKALYDTAAAVRSCVRYESGVKPWEERASGDCYTFTWILSDLAESLGFESRIVFSNGHAFNMVITRTGKVHVINADSGDELWFFDTESNPISIDMLSPEAIRDAKLAKSASPSYHSLYTSRLRDYSDHKNSTLGTPGLPWIEDLNPAAAIMTPEQGKRALFAYACWLNALENGNLQEVLTSLEGLNGCNPQAETRRSINSDLGRFLVLVKKWAHDEAASLDSIHQAITKYRGIMPETKSMLTLIGDCYRHTAAIREDLYSLDMAKECYEYAGSIGSNAADETLAGKQKKASELEAILSGVKSASRERPLGKVMLEVIPVRSVYNV